MKILRILSGVAILFTTLAFGHLLEHYYTRASAQDLHSPAFLAAMALAVVAGVLSFIGAVLLLRGSR
jgi:dolichyl-phosphate-mannose--protein O-mannosyl transferase